ncbi:MAG: ABC transporter ATP-binding protein [Lachnospiraceae bacterium]|nr:ABC transporter ATP-binding protein [Lachnospiraceae bacterium]
MSETTNDVILEAKNLTKVYPIRGSALLPKNRKAVHAVDGVSFQLRRGKTLGLVGESGCGKSTTGRLLVGIETPTGGEVLYEGEDLLKMKKEAFKKARLNLQMIFQDPYASLNPRKRVVDILTAPILYHGLETKDTVDQRVEELLEMVGLPKSAKARYPHEFSGGQRQRITIARALALKPEVIVCDEPVSALDASIQAQILNLLRSLQKELGVTYLFIAHGLGAVHYISDEIAVMYLGRIVETGEGQEVFHHPAHPYAQLLIQAVPSMDPKKRGQITVPDGEVPSAIDLPEGCRFAERCPYATQKCRSREPELLQVPGGAPGHLAACWHPIGGKNPGEEA